MQMQNSQLSRLLEFIANNFIARVVTAVIVIECILLGVILVGVDLDRDGASDIQFDAKIGLSIFIGAPLFVVTLLELNRGVKIQKASFVKEYISRLFMDPELNNTFHDLIYTFDNDTYSRLQAVAKEKFPDVEELAHQLTIYGHRKPIFDIFSTFNEGRSEGARLFHPALFQGSTEERRVDAFMHYINVIGYYYYIDLISMKDVFGSMSFYFLILCNRDVVRDYLKICEKRWNSLPKDKTMNTPHPFAYIENLLSDFKDYAIEESAKTKRGLRSID